MQIAKRRISGAEIIDAQLNTQSFQLSEYCNGHFRILHNRTLRDLKLQVSRIKVGVLQYCSNLAHQPRLRHLFSGEIYAHEERAVHGRLPLPLDELSAGSLKDPVAERQNKSLLFRHSNELGRTNHPAFRVLPPYQRFKSAEFSIV